MVYIINGYTGSGKDTFVELVSKLWDKVQQNSAFPSKVTNISTIDYLKAVFKKEFGWDGEKTAEVRNALASIHQALVTWNDLPFTLTCNNIRAELAKGNIVFVHCREPENIKKYVKEFNAMTVFVENERVKSLVVNFPETYSTADLNVENYKYDIYINNNGTFEDLEKEAKSFVYDSLIGF